MMSDQYSPNYRPELSVALVLSQEAGRQTLQITESCTTLIFSFFDSKALCWKAARCFGFSLEFFVFFKRNPNAHDVFSLSLPPVSSSCPPQNRQTAASFCILIETRVDDDGLKLSVKERRKW